MVAYIGCFVPVAELIRPDDEVQHIVDACMTAASEGKLKKAKDAKAVIISLGYRVGGMSK
jgi:hypothetical protein